MRVLRLEWGREVSALRQVAAIVVLALVGRAPGADAQETDPEPPLEAPLVEVVAEPEPEPEIEDPTSSGEVVVMDERTAGATLPDLLDDLPGVRVRRLGGLESYATVSIRGSTASQVLVLRDGIPLGSASAAEVDLSEIPLTDVERIEVYRGPSAAHFGSGGLGGVVSLVGRELQAGAGAAGRVELGLGSFLPGGWEPARIFGFSARRSVAGSVSGDAGPLTLRASGTLLQSAGDFTFLDDNGTFWEAGDDRFARRANNDASEGDLSVSGAAELSRGLTLSAGETASVRVRGVPGYGADLSSRARLRTAGSLTTLQVVRAATSSSEPSVLAGLGVRLRRDEWVDRLGEIGVGREHDDDLTVDVSGRVRLGWAVRQSSLGLQGEVRGEQLLARPRLAPTEGWGWRRASGGLSGWVSWTLAGGMVELAPQVRLELVGDGATGDGPPLPAGSAPLEERTRLFSSGQLGVLVRPLRWLALRAATGLTQRPPAFLELLGDRGSVSGNPGLRPETGWSVDGGIRLDGRRLGPMSRGRIEVTGFLRLVEDLIQLVPNSQTTFVAANLGGASIAGLEAAGGLTIDWGRAAGTAWPGLATLRGGLTLMDAVDRSGRPFLEGRQLPLRPRWEAFGRLAATFGPLEVAYELDYLSGNFLDPYNSWPVPHRLIHSAEATADLSRWGGPAITLLARNLGDQITEVVPVRGIGELRRPVADVAGFPLPGLTVLLTLRWDLPAGTS